jgi:hypothetical protein
MTLTWMADTYRKEGNDNGLHDSIRAINGDGDDAVHARNVLRMCRFAAVRWQHGKQNSAHELGRGHRPQRRQTTQDAMDIVRGKLLTARAREQL